MKSNHKILHFRVIFSFKAKNCICLLPFHEQHDATYQKKAKIEHLMKNNIFISGSKSRSDKTRAIPLVGLYKTIM